MKKYTIMNPSFHEVDKILNDYITIHNKKVDFYFINCEFNIEFDNNFTTNIETKYFYHIDSKIIKSYLLYYIDCFRSRGYNFYNINLKTTHSIGDRCNMTYEHYMNQPMQSVELRQNMVAFKNRQLITSLDRNKNHPLFRKCSQLPFKN